MTPGEVRKRVSEFYNSLPFNYDESTAASTRTLRNANQIIYYKDVHELLKAAHAKRVLDVGCGTGWFANSVAFHYRLEAVGTDLCEPALERARKISRELETQGLVWFKCLDLFELPYVQEFFLVNSLGVLHHTHDCREALERVSRAAERRGYLYIGLYHKYGRRPFLELFEKHRERFFATGELDKRDMIEAFELYREMNAHIKDETFLWSWFRDQVFHPHETHHTFEEVHEWLSGLGFEVLSTSINAFQPIPDVTALFQEEKKLYDVSVERNHKRKVYFPGFFTVLARRVS